MNQYHVYLSDEDYSHLGKFLVESDCAGDAMAAAVRQIPKHENIIARCFLYAAGIPHLTPIDFQVMKAKVVPL